jgi:hypothetical protein
MREWFCHNRSLTRNLKPYIFNDKLVQTISGYIVMTLQIDQADSGNIVMTLQPARAF